MHLFYCGCRLLATVGPQREGPHLANSASNLGSRVYGQFSPATGLVERYSLGLATASMVGWSLGGLWWAGTRLCFLTSPGRLEIPESQGHLGTGKPWQFRNSRKSSCAIKKNASGQDVGVPSA